jgi:hypothetical protein
MFLSLCCLLFALGAASFPGLPSICICSDPAAPNATSIASCSFRPDSSQLFGPCPVSVKNSIPFSTNDGQDLQCSCAIGFPSSCSSVSCFATFSLVGSARWAFVFDQFSPRRVIDAYNELEASLFFMFE